MHPSTVEVDLTAIEHNVGVFRELLSRSASAGGEAAKLCAVLKADAYGLGAARVAKRLSILNIDMLAVYTPQQARDLIAAAVMTPILILMPADQFDRSDPIYRAASAGRVHFTVHDPQSLAAITELGERLGIVLPVHVDVDTGMGRGGSEPVIASQMIAMINDARRLRLAGVSTHFASAEHSEEMTQLQAKRFGAWLKELGDAIPDDAIIHASNSFGTLRSGKHHHSMVRVGLGLLGYGSEMIHDDGSVEHIQAARKLKPALQWTSRIVQARWVDEGQTVGYSSTWTAPRRTRVALVPVGYADGYPLALSADLRTDTNTQYAPTTKVGIPMPPEWAGELEVPPVAYVPVIGRVSMDQITVDITDLPEQLIGVGSTVEIVSRNTSAPNHLPKLAKAAASSTHEMLCRVSHRVERTYLAMEVSREQQNAKAGMPQVVVRDTKPTTRQANASTAR